MSPVHSRDKVCYGVKVPADVGHGGAHYGSQLLVICSNGGRGIVAEPHCVVVMGNRGNK